jgi:hypothetical protein
MDADQTLHVEGRRMTGPMIWHNETIDGLELCSKAIWPDGTAVRSSIRWRTPEDGRAHIADAKASFEDKYSGAPPERSGRAMARTIGTPWGDVGVALRGGAPMRWTPRFRVSRKHLSLTWFHGSVFLGLVTATVPG